MPDRQNRPIAADEFTKARSAEWEALALRAAGATALSELARSTYDGIMIDPLYTRSVAPDPAPFRSVPASQMSVRPLVAEPTPEAAKAAIAAEIAGGAEEILLQFVAPGHPGIDPGTSETVELLKDVDPGTAAIHLRHPAAPSHASAALLAWWQEAVAPKDRSGGFGIDAIGAVATGAMPFAWLDEDGLARDADMVLAGIREAPWATVLTASGRPCHEAGGSEAQELAAMLATGVAYLRACETRDIGLEDAAPRIALELTADAEVFLTIAKLRAARLLWARVLGECGAGEVTARLDVQTSARMMCVREPEVNMARTTCAALAAGIGGADAITVLPHTHAIGRPDGFARRIARNTPLILRDESLIGVVADAAHGAFAIESLTEELSERAWELFAEIEAGGGIVEVLRSGSLQKRIGETRDARARDIAEGKAILVGATAFEADGADTAAEPWGAPPPVAGAIELLRPIRLEPGPLS